MRSNDTAQVTESGHSTSDGSNRVFLGRTAFSPAQPQADTSPARPESAETASLPRAAPIPRRRLLSCGCVVRKDDSNALPLFGVSKVTARRFESWKGARTVPPNPPHLWGRLESTRAVQGETGSYMNDGSRVFLSRPLWIVGAKWPHWMGNEMIIPPITS